MKKYLIYCLVALFLVAIYVIQIRRISELQKERDKYRANTEALIKDVHEYQTIDSLNAAEIGALVLSLDEYRRYRSEDMALIKTLQTKNRDLEHVTTAQTLTIAELKGTVKDSVIYVDNYLTDTLRCLDIVNKWYEFHGCTDKYGEFSGKFVNRDSILIAATIKYKRFLGFLWKTSKIKSRKIDAVSKNPYTKLIGIEYIEIEK